MTISTDRARSSRPTAGAGADDQDAAAGRARLTKVVVANVVLLTMIAPLATDMYVPAFPVVGSDLGAACHRGAAHPDHLLRRDGAGPARRRAGLGPARSTSAAAGRRWS